MYWFRADNPLIFLLWLAVAAVWGVGGWLLAAHAFRLEARERLVVGFGLGLVSYLWLANLLGRWLPPAATFILAAFLVAGLGLAYAWKGERPLLDLRDLRAWQWLVLGLALAWLFLRIAKGLAIFDDRKNISIVSTMATGDIPPHHYMNSTFYFAYHYGFQLLGASLMRLGGLLPWSAFDLSKAIVGAYTLVLLGLFARRYLELPWAAGIVAGVVALSTGTRYLLLLAPAGLMARIDPLIFVRSVDEVVGMPLSQAILQGLVLKDGPPAPFLYAFMNGIGWPLVMAIHAGPSTLSFAILLLAWMVAPRLKGPASAFVLLILFSFWALVWESSYGLFLVAGLAAALYWAWKRRWVQLPAVRWIAVALVLSIPFALLQGGTITEMARGLVSSSGSAPPATGQEVASIAGFSIRWPPAVYSGHLSALSLFSPYQLFVAILELGPLVLFVPWITGWAWKRFQAGDWMLGASVLSAWIGFALPVFFSYEYDRDIVRFTKHGLMIWTIVLGFMLWDSSTRWLRALRIPAAIALVLMVFGGLAIAGTELTAASQTVLTEEGITGLDSRVACEVWDRLNPGSEIFDPQTWRATMVTGRLTRVVASNMSFDYEHSTEWEGLRAQPSVEAFLDSGYQYVYVDEAWWAELPEASRASLSIGCVRVVSEQEEGVQDAFRRILDLDPCRR
ncbi:MAG TPA: hypothetical protein VGA03_09730 [Anaerolineales bacterium]